MTLNIRIQPTDEHIVDSILVLFGLIIKISIMGFATFVVLHILRGMKKRTLRDEISKIDAKMSAYRINLKGRVKKKAKIFRASYPSSITDGEPIDVCLKHLTELTFEKNSDYQDYIELCKKINSFINLANIDKNSEAAQAALNDPDKYDFMGADFKNEISIVRLINDMVAVSKTLNKQMNRYNNFDRRARLQVPETINFASLFELQKVFKNNEGKEETTAKTSEMAKSA